MSLLQLGVLALVQGLTEFLPVSSSAHLILVPVVTGWPDQGLVYDVAAHLGTLAAVCWCFRCDLARMAVAWAASLRGAPSAEGRRAWFVLLATVPAALAGLLLHDVIASELRSARLIAATTAGFGLLLWYADRAGRRSRELESIGWRDALIVGCAQALALVPGTSRSGITITAGLLLGLTRVAAARFSFLMAVPITALAVLREGARVLDAEVQASVAGLAVVAGLSFGAAWLAIRLFLALLDRIGMAPFAIYRLLLAAVLFLVWS